MYFIMGFLHIGIFFAVAIITCRSTTVCPTAEGYLTNTGCYNNTDTDRNVVSNIDN